MQQPVFDSAAEQARLAASSDAVGAIASFVGYVRADGAVRGLELEHYPGMTEQCLRRIVARARQRWPLLAVTVIHRVGYLAVGEPIVVVLAASSHRQAAFDACAYIMDYLKTEAPFWKKEFTEHGARWVDARSSDDAARARWGD